MISTTPLPMADSPAGLADHEIVELSELFKLLGDPNRLRILLLICRHGELNVTSMCDKLGLQQPLVSHHLALLRMAGVLELRRQGKEHHYRVCRKRFGQMMQVLNAQAGRQRSCQRFLECVFD